MNRNRMLIRISVLMAVVGIAAGAAWGGAADIKARMAERLPLILELKHKGIVGENNRGLLEFVSSVQEKADVIAAENEDRQAVYEAIAKKTGTSALLVGQRRAKQIAEQAGKGEWYQNESGQWLQKM